jgi:preprotein translocase subunit SecY
VGRPVEAFRNALKIPELKRRIIFTLIMLAIYRLGAHVPTPGVDGRVLAERMTSGGLLGFYDIFSGGAFRNATVFALGIMPYISASIILSLLVAVVPSLEKLSKSGQEGQKKITEYTRYGTIGLCIIQAVGIAAFLQNMGAEIVAVPGFRFILMCVISFTTGTAFIMWLGEQISEFGLGNGISLIIFISIISRMPNALIDVFKMIRNNQLNIFQTLILVVLMGIVVAGAILVTTGQRRIPVQYPRQVKGRKVFGGQRSYLPLRVNQAGVIPIIFASSILMLPGFLQGALSMPAVDDFFNNWFHSNGIVYNLFYAILIIFFSYFYTAITFNPVEIADNMKKYGGVIMGVRPGKATADYLNRVMVRITLVGSLFLAVVALLPNIVWGVVKVYDWNIVGFFGGTSLLILVGVALDTVRQIEQHLLMRHYDGFSGPGGRRLRGRRSY